MRNIYNSYWSWTSSGPKWHWLAGIGGPLLVLLFIIGAVSGEEEEQPGANDSVVQAPVDIPEGATQARVVRVIDGDTVEVQLVDGSKKTIRYIGVDTPETVAPGRPIDCFGPEATAATKKMVDGRTVFLEKDISETDRYARTLRYVWLDTGQMANEQLVLQGFAQVSTYPPDVKYQDRFLAAQQRARETNAGLWGGCQTAESPPPGTATQPSPPTVATTSTQVPTAVPTATPVVTTNQQPAGNAPVAPLVPMAPANTAVPPPTSTRIPPPPPTVTVAPAPSQNCHPSYTGACLRPDASDYDCAGGSGNGPFYTGRVTVVGLDVFQLDADHDGIGCE